MTGEAPDRVASDGAGEVGLSDDALKVGRYFPTHIFSVKVPGCQVLNERLIEAIHAEQERDRTGVRKSNYPQLGGWHSQTKLHKNAAFAGLVQYVNAATDMMCRKLGYHESYRLNIGTMWSIVNPPGGSNRAHVHPGCIWSGVYYVQAPENSGGLEFIDPRTENLMSPVKYIPGTKRPRDCWTKVRFKPLAGKMLIFPSWLYHGVGPNKSTAGGKDADRIILSFNLSQVRRRKPQQHRPAGDPP
ncbi:MAG: TIGR02466 family protein [Gammaproteobacteria bacterium]|nr:TIGR02466 family protein [Gammaproteobacteria bacterium]MDE0271469.1 TIGR02466 family protein [Gammaproteobacteria bacterium]